MKVAHIILHILSVQEVSFFQLCVEANIDVRLQCGCQHSTETEGIDVVPRRPWGQGREEWKPRARWSQSGTVQSIPACPGRVYLGCLKCLSV